MEFCNFIDPVIIRVGHTNQIHSRYGSIFLSMKPSQISDPDNSDFEFFLHVSLYPHSTYPVWQMMEIPA